MKKIALFAACGLLAATQHAFAASSNNFYVGIKAGTAFMNVDDMSNTSDIANPAAINNDSEDDAVLILGGTVGYNWETHGAPIRTELEYSYRHDFSYDADPTYISAATPTRMTSQLSSHAVMANVYYDIKTKSKFTPFIGGGIGVSRNKTQSDVTVIATNAPAKASTTKNNFAWNLGAGVGYQLTDAITLDASYRYVDLGKAVWGTPTMEITGQDLTSHEVTIGLRYAF